MIMHLKFNLNCYAFSVENFQVAERERQRLIQNPVKRLKQK